MEGASPAPGAGETVAAAAVATILSACASGAPEPPRQVLDSRVRNPAVRVDGERTDWEGNLTRVGDRRVFAGFHRAGDTLYVALVSQDPGFDARVFGAGLTVWFDAAGTRRSGAYGLRYPVLGPEARQRLGADTAGARPDRERILRAAGSEVVLVRDSSEETVDADGDPGGLRVAASIDRGLFTWEARVPLGDGPGALRATRSDTISLGLQAGGDQGAASRPSPGERAAAESASGRGGGDRRLGGPGPAQVPPLEVWVRVNLEEPGG